ncbi:PrgI family protein [Patescibacteria group bacterium]|nr:PrgI family protein [Patescibacteria group bacterium]
MEGTKEHAIPQNIMSVEFKLIGDMSLKQFAYIAVPLFIGFMFYVFHVNTSLTIILTVIFLLLAMFLAFVPIDGRPADTFLTNFIVSIKNPTQRVFNKSTDIPDILKISRRNTPSYVNREASNFLYQSPADFTISNSDNTKSSSQLDDREKLMMQNIDSAIRSANISPSTIPNTVSVQNNQGSVARNIGGMDSQNTNTEYNPFDINDTNEDIAKNDVAESANININSQLLNENNSNLKSEDVSLLNSGGPNPAFQNPIDENNISATPVQSANIDINDVYSNASNSNVSNLGTTPQTNDNNTQNSIRSNMTTTSQIDINDTLNPSTRDVIPNQAPSIDPSINNDNTSSNIGGTDNDVQGSLNSNPSQNISDANNVQDASSSTGNMPTSNTIPINSSVSNNSTNTNVEGTDNNMQNLLNSNSSSNISNTGNVQNNSSDTVNMSTPNAVPTDNVVQDSTSTVNDSVSNSGSQNQLNTILDKIKALEDENRRLKEELESEDLGKNKESLEDEAPVVNQQELINHLPDFVNTPNVVSGIVLTHDSKILTNAIVIIKDTSSKPIRAVKTNQLGQFYLRTPLANGQYNVEVTYPGIAFNAVGLNLDGSKINPLIFVPVEN